MQAEQFDPKEVSADGLHLHRAVSLFVAHH